MVLRERETETQMNGKVGLFFLFLYLMCTMEEQIHSRSYKGRDGCFFFNKLQKFFSKLFFICIERFVLFIAERKVCSLNM
jgi:hypothetical protein